MTNRKISEAKVNEAMAAMREQYGLTEEAMADWRSKFFSDFEARMKSNPRDAEMYEFIKSYFTWKNLATFLVVDRITVSVLNRLGVENKWIRGGIRAAVNEAREFVTSPDQYKTSTAKSFAWAQDRWSQS